MAQETLNLHSDPPAFLFSRQRGCLRAQIAEQVLARVRQRVRVVRDRPAIGSQRLYDNVMMDIPGGRTGVRATAARNWHSVLAAVSRVVCGGPESNRPRAARSS